MYFSVSSMTVTYNLNCNKKVMQSNSVNLSGLAEFIAITVLIYFVVPFGTKKIVLYNGVPLHFCSCTTCGHTLQAKQIKDGNASLTDELRKLDRTDSEVLEDFLKKYATVLPDTHQVSISSTIYKQFLLAQIPNAQKDSQVVSDFLNSWDLRSKKLPSINK